MSSLVNHPTTNKPECHGFALVIALSLMAFVLLLLLSITTLVQVESSSARTSIDQLAARQNALLALHMAVGQLQKEAGPDQRVTARADILDTTLAEAGQWTGSWKSYDPDDEDAHLGTIRSLNEASPVWLVSGNDAATTADPSVTPTSKVTILNYIDRNDQPQTVEVPRVATNSQGDTGGFAWWTSDESTKAKINPKSIDQSGFGTTINESQRRFMAPQKAALQTVSADDWGDVMDSPESVEKTSTLGSLSLLAGSTARNDFAERYSTDVTTHSLGLLVNNRKGGLRKDLTYGLGNVTQYEQHLSLLPQLEVGVYDDSRLLYSDETKATSAIDVYGESWDTFFNYYNLYKVDYPRPSKALRINGVADDAYDLAARVKNLNNNIDGDPFLFPRADRYIGTSAVVRTLNKSKPNQLAIKDNDQPMSNLSNDYRRVPFNTIRPAPVQVKINYGIQTYPYTDPDTGDISYRFRLHLYPTFVVCNPYNTRLYTGAAPNQADYQGNYTLYFTCQSGYGITIENQGQENIYGNYTVKGKDDAGNEIDVVANLFGQFVLAIPDVTLEPGQVMIFGLKESTIWPEDEEKLELEGVTGSNIKEDYSISIDIMYNEGGNPKAPNLKHLTSTDANADVSFHFYNNKISNQVDLNLPELRSHTNFRRNQFAAYLDGHTKQIGTVGSLNTLPVPLVGYHMKAQTSASDFPAFAHLNPISYNSMTYLMYAGSGEDIGDFADALPHKVGDDAYWGNGFTSEDEGSRRLIFYDIPRQPMQSIGDFMHASFGFVEEDPLYVVGSSYASPFMDSTKTYFERTGAGYPGHKIFLTDRPYYINDRIFDEYFFSTVPTSGRDDSKTFPYDVTFDQAYIDAGSPLQNTRLIYNNIDGARPTQAALQGQDSTNSTDAFSTAAANLLIDGPFNINSTSVDAWVATLSALRDQELKVSVISDSAAPTTQTLSSSSLENPFPRLTAPRGTPNTAWTGFSSLSDEEVESLAISIVEQIKGRGPFLSLGDFINRDPHSATLAHRTRGALQSAIEDSIVNDDINIGQTPTLSTAPQTGTGEFTLFTDNLATSTAANIPGWLSQNDIVRNIAPIITARGDTFIIRCYGDSKDDLNDTTKATAICEAVVQRLPNYVSSTDSPTTANADVAWTDATPSNLKSSINQQFGRNFKIIAFRWINQI